MGIHKITSALGVEAVRSGRFKISASTTSWFFRIGDTLIDSGSPSEWKHVQKYAQRNKIRQVILTHHHEDHSGNAGYLQDQFKDIQILAPSKSIDILRSGFDMEFYRHLFFGKPPTVVASPYPSKFMLEDGFDLLPISCPGHSYDHTVLYAPEKKLLFSADLLVTTEPENSTIFNNPAMEIEDLKYILHNCDFDTVFCGHKGIVLNGRKELETKLEWLQSIQKKVYDFHNAHSELAAKAIRRHVLGNEMFKVQMLTHGNFSKTIMVDSFLRQNTDRDCQYVL